MLTEGVAGSGSLTAGRGRLRVVAVAGALAALLTACSSGGEPAAERSASAAVPSPTASSGGSTPAPAPTGTPGDESAAPVLTLEGDGLGLLAADDSEERLPFGTAPAEAVRQVVEDALGVPEVVELPGCPQGPRTALRVDGFTVLLEGDRFVGWTDVGAPDRSLTTPDGVGAGGRLEDLLSALPGAVVAQDAAGRTVFTSPQGLAGVLSGPEPTAVLSALSAGQTCPDS